jgi:hypothetical protein
MGGPRNIARPSVFFSLQFTKSTRLQRDVRQSAETQRTRGGRRQVYDAAAHERSPIIDPHDNAATIALVSDTHPRSKWERAVGGRKPTGVSALSACGFLAGIGVDGSDSGLSNRGG